MSRTGSGRRTLALALLFWAAVAAALALDWAASAPYDRFAEPPPWAIGQPAGPGGAHCTVAPAAGARPATGP